MEAVIFDLFGVLAENGWGLIDSTYQPSKDQWESLSAVSHAADMGIISMEELQQSFADTLDIPVAEITNLISTQKKNIRLIQYIDQLRGRGLKVGLISNVAFGFVEKYFSKVELAMFDVRVLSNEEGLVKPDPRIYKKAAAELGVDEEACLFVDDSQINVAGAEAVGMQAVLYTAFDSFKAEVNGLLKGNS